jgi:N-hydroxyarylamine O-acetyltransferase
LDSTLDLDAYLARIGYRGALKPDLDTLIGLHEAHVGTIPFENLDVLLRRPIRLDLASVQAQLVGARRGGYCFQHGPLFTAVLQRVGFTVTTLAARVRMGASVLRPRSHMLLKVENGKGTWLADVGFGGQGLLHPLVMAAGATVAGPGGRYRLTAEGDTLLVLQGDFGDGWLDFYAFTQEPNFPCDYEVSNHFTATHPHSPFTSTLTAQLTRPQERLILRNRSLEIWHPDGQQMLEIESDDALLSVLRDRFGLDFPVGTRFPLPTLQPSPPLRGERVG